MKFGKYLAKRQLDLPEYANYFINYKALKKLIKSLSVVKGHSFGFGDSDVCAKEKALQENKSTFFFHVERELEKVNSFYLQKEAELKLRLEILYQKKKEAQQRGELDSKTSVSYISLYEGFQRFRRDLERLEQFIELNGTGFSKVLKKWDKQSKSRTKELYLTRAVEIQPVFHREELSHFSDLATQSLMELETWSTGDAVMVEVPKNDNETAQQHNNKLEKKTHLVHREKDDLFHEFVRTAAESKDNQDIQQWVDRLKTADDAQESITRIFLLAISTDASDEALMALWKTGCVDIYSVDDISGKNCLHRAASADTMRTKIVELALHEKVDINQVDVYGRVPLHYACLHNRRDFLQLFVKHGADINALDKDNFTPLLYSIVNCFTGCVQDLITSGARVDVDSDKDYVPLNFACQYGVYDAVKILLDKNPRLIVADAEGLFPIHIVARAGHASLIPLLKSYGVNVNELDKLNNWTALCYAASEGHYAAVDELLKVDADPFIADDNGRTPLFYAAWEGRAKCLHALAQRLPPDGTGEKGAPITYGQKIRENNEKKTVESRLIIGTESMELSTEELSPEEFSPELSADEKEEMTGEIDMIPDLELPPPIIPVRRYGHNFLDKKIILQLLFDPSTKTIKFFREEDSISAGRLMIVTKNASANIIPRSIILPIGDPDRAITFDLESIDNFVLDFEIYSTFGTKVIAKACALPSVFESYQNSDYSDLIYRLPLFNSRLVAVGEISFKFQIVKPFEGKPLEITKYDTYWKSTSQLGETTNSQEHVSQTLSFVTASSLSGRYANVSVCLTRDSVPVVGYTWTVDVQGIKIPIGNLSWDEISRIRGNDTEELYRVLHQETDPDSIYQLLQNKVIPLDRFLASLPSNIKLNLNVLYPTHCEFPVLSFGTSSFCELNQYVDQILKVLFDHARELRKATAEANGKQDTPSRSVIFSSFNPEVCTVLNWKQPNYPVFFNMQALRLDGNYQSAHGLLDMTQNEDRRCVSLKDGANFASKNNLLGIICSGELLRLVPSLVNNVRVYGLVLVTHDDNYKEVEDVDGLCTTTSLTFKETIDM